MRRAARCFEQSVVTALVLVVVLLLLVVIAMALVIADIVEIVEDTSATT